MKATPPPLDTMATEELRLNTTRTIMAVTIIRPSRQSLFGSSEGYIIILLLFPPVRHLLCFCILIQPHLQPHCKPLTIICLCNIRNEDIWGHSTHKLRNIVRQFCWRSRSRWISTLYFFSIKYDENFSARGLIVINHLHRWNSTLKVINSTLSSGAERQVVMRRL